MLFFLLSFVEMFFWTLTSCGLEENFKFNLNLARNVKSVYSDMLLRGG
jgi:hypothetical protein